MEEKVLECSNDSVVIPVIDCTPLEYRKKTILNELDVTWNRVSGNERKNSKVKSITVYETRTEIEVDLEIFLRFYKDWAEAINKDINYIKEQIEMVQFYSGFSVNLYTEMGLLNGEINIFSHRNKKIKSKIMYKLINGFKLHMIISEDNDTRFIITR